MSLIRAYAQLCRAPVAFSAVSNSAIAVLVAGGHLALWQWLCLITISATSVMAGMVWNDISDFAEDAVDRKSRPLHGGLISISRAKVVGGILTSIAIICGIALGPIAFVVVISLHICILSYNFGSRGKWLGPVWLVLCRIINADLGYLIGWQSSHNLDRDAKGLFVFSAYTLLLVITMVVISLIARNETKGLTLTERHRSQLALIGLWFVGLLIPWGIWWWQYFDTPVEAIVTSSSTRVFTQIYYPIFANALWVYVGLKLRIIYTRLEDQDFPLPAIVGTLLAYLPMLDAWAVVQVPLGIYWFLFPIAAIYIASWLRKWISLS